MTDALEKLGKYYRGSRVGVILIHGVTGTPTEMSTLAKELNRYGFSVLCPLLEGHCGTEEDLLKATWLDWAKSVENAYNEFAKHVDVIFVGGLCAGATLGLHLARMLPGKIRGLCLCSVLLKYDGWTIPKLNFLLPLYSRIPYFGKRYRFSEAWPYGIKNERIRNKIYTQMSNGDSAAAGNAGTPGAVALELNKFCRVIKSELPEITTPAILFHSQDDDIVSVRNAIYVKNHLGGTSLLVALYNSYHMVTIDQERDVVFTRSAKYFYDLLNEQEQAELVKHIANDPKGANLIETLKNTEPYIEYPASELLKGLTPRRDWLGALG